MYTRSAIKYAHDDPARYKWCRYSTDDFLAQTEGLSRLIPPSAKSVLEVGCGGGFLGDAIVRNNPHVTYAGFDIVSENVKDAQQSFPHLYFYTGNYWNELTNPTFGFDFVVSASCLFTTTAHEYAELLFDVLHNISKKGFAFYYLRGKEGTPADIVSRKMDEIHDLSYGVSKFYHSGDRDFLPKKLMKRNAPVVIWREGIKKVIDVEVPSVLTSKDIGLLP